MTKFGFHSPEIGSYFLKTTHGKIVLCGLIVGLFYLPTWLWLISVFILSGGSYALVAAAATYLGAGKLWTEHYQIVTLKASSNSRRVGHFLVLFGSILFAFGWHKTWRQAICLVLILIGIALSSWGLRFFQRYWRYILLLLFGVYPGALAAIGIIWRVTISSNILDRLMASSGAKVLQLMGYEARATDTSIELPTGAVSVGWGCNGFDLAVTMAVVSLLIAVVFYLSWVKTLELVILAIILSLVSNVGRIVLLTLAAVYWGEQIFEFWHSSWGGQVFSFGLFAAYYYLVRWILPPSPP